MDVEPAQVEAALARIKPQIEASDFELMTRLWGTLTMVIGLVRAQRATIARLRRFFGMTSSEKTRDVVGSPSSTTPDTGSTAASDEPAGNSGNDGGPTTESAPDKAKPKGHGRLGASAYPAAQQIDVPHESLKLGCVCPGCGRGKLYALKEPARIPARGRPADLDCAVLELSTLALRQLRSRVHGASATASTGPEVR